MTGFAKPVTLSENPVGSVSCDAPHQYSSPRPTAWQITAFPSCSALHFCHLAQKHPSLKGPCRSLTPRLAAQTEAKEEQHVSRGPRGRAGFLTPTRILRSVSNTGFIRLRAEGLSFREAVAFYIRFCSKQKATGVTGKGGTTAAPTKPVRMN